MNKPTYELTYEQAYKIAEQQEKAKRFKSNYDYFIYCGFEEEWAVSAAIIETDIVIEREDFEIDYLPF